MKTILASPASISRPAFWLKCLASLFGVACAFVSSATAQTAISWANASTDYATGTNWTGNSAPADDTTTNRASFGTASPTAQPNLSANRSVAGVVFASGAGAFTFSGTGNPVLTLGASGIVQQSTSTQTFDSSLGLKLGAAASFTLSSSGALSIASTVNNSGNLLTLSGGGTGSGTISGVVSGSGGLTKNGNWTLTLGNTANTYGGVTTISGGTLSVGALANGGANSSIGASGIGAANLVLGGGTLKYTGAGDSTDRLFTVGTGPGPANATLNASGTGNLLFTNSGAIAFGGSVTTSTLTLTGTGTGSLAASVGNSSISTSINKTGTGTWTLTGNDTYSGSTTINGGVLNLSSATGNMTGTTSVNVSSGGTFNVGDTGNGVANRINTSATLTLGGGNGGGTFNLLRGSTTTGDQTLASLTVASGVSAITGGASSSNAVPTLTFSSATPYSRSVGGLVDITNANLTTTFTSAPSGAGNVAGSGADAILVGATLNSSDFIAAASGTASAVTYTTTGTSTWTAGMNMDVTGTNGAAYTAANVNSVRFNTAGANTVTLAAGTNNITSGMILVTTSVGTNASAITGGNITGGVGTDLLVIQNNSNALSIGSIIADNTSATGLTKSGSGSLVLSAANTYTGNTTVNAGAVTVNSGGSLGTGSLNVLTGATLNLNNATQSVTGLNGGGTINFGTNHVLTANVTSGGPIFSGVLSGSSGSLVKSGSSSLTLSGANNYGGGTTISAGSLVFSGTNTSVGNITVSGGSMQIGAAGTLPNTTNLTLNGGSLSMGGAFTEGLGTLTIGSGGTINFGSGGAGTLSFTDSSAITWSGTLTIQNYITGTSSLQFIGDTTGNFSTQVGLISFSGYTNSGAATIDGSGFVTPTGTAVPEPSTYAAIIGLLSFGFVIYRRRRAA